MKAAYYTKYGSPEYLTIEEVKKPVPNENEILVEVYATTVNRSDYAVLQGSLLMRLFSGLKRPKRAIPGTDFAGKVVQVGKKVTKFKTGDRVFGFDDSGLSSQAQYMVVGANKAIAAVPDNLSYEQAVASLEGAHYAINFVNKVYLKPGQKVLVNGATGAIGSALVQLSKYYQLYVTATCRAAHFDLVKSLGADKVIDYTTQSLLDETEKYDYVFDSVGKSTFGQCKSILKKGGIYISSELGPRAENLFLALTTKITGSHRVIFPMPYDIRKSIQFILNLIAEGKFKPVIDKRFPLEEVREAFTYVGSGQKVGNVILVVNQNRDI